MQCPAPSLSGTEWGCNGAAELAWRRVVQGGGAECVHDGELRVRKILSNDVNGSLCKNHLEYSVGLPRLQERSVSALLCTGTLLFSFSNSIHFALSQVQAGGDRGEQRGVCDGGAHTFIARIHGAARQTRAVCHPVGHAPGRYANRSTLLMFVSEGK